MSLVFATGSGAPGYQKVAGRFRYLRYPFTDSKRRSLSGALWTSQEQGGDQIEYADQSPRIQQLYEEATKTAGVKPQMSKFLSPQHP